MPFRHKVFLVISFLIFASSVMAAQDGPAIRASVDKKTINIGDRIKYAIEVRGGNNLEVKFPDFADNKIGEFEIKDTGLKINKGFFGKQTFLNWYYITAYSVGKQTIPPIEIKYKEKAKKDWKSKKTKDTLITVESVLPKGGYARDIKDIKGPMGFHEINWILSLGALLMLLFSYVLIVSYKRKMRQLPVKLPHETALEELEAMRGLLSKTGNIKDYYVGISDCVRRYIERVFSLKAPEMTTEEFLNSLKDSKILSLEQKDLLKIFLNACDLVKFAKYTPPADEIESVYLTAKNFIEETKNVHI